MVLGGLEVQTYGGYGMKKSYFAGFTGNKGVSIALKHPDGFSGPECPELFPKKDFLFKYFRDHDERAYTEAYHAQVLNKLDPQSTYEKLRDKVILCWEKPGEFCHRNLVASWIEEKLGIEVPEWEPSRNKSSMDLIYLDFETGSARDIKYGSWQYAEHPSTFIINLCLILDEDPEVWWPDQPFPVEAVTERLEDPDTYLAAWNAEFDMLVWNFKLAPLVGVPVLPPSKWVCAQSDALTCGYPAKLEMAAKALDVPVLKNTAGKRLINTYSKPQKDGTFKSIHDHPEDKQLMADYVRDDVLAMRSVHRRLPRWGASKGKGRDAYLMTVDINQRGMLIDLPVVKKSAERWEEYKDVLNARLPGLTGGAVDTGNQIAKIVKFLNDTHELNLPDLRAPTVRDKLKEGITEEAAEILKIRQMVSAASLKKYAAMKQSVCLDGRIRNMFKFHKSRTGRYAGAGVQVQNLPRQTKFYQKQPEDPYELATDECFEYAEMVFGSYAELLKNNLRGMIIATLRKKFRNADFSSVESCGRAWLTNDEEQMQVFIDGRDPYLVLASEMYGIPYEDLSKESPERDGGKIGDLACGYQGSIGAILGMAVNMGMDFTRKEAGDIVRRFRRARPLLVTAWYAFEAAAMEAMTFPGKKVKVDGCRPTFFQVYKNHLFMRLPSGRSICYPQPKIQTVTIEWVDEDGIEKSAKKKGITTPKVESGQWRRVGMSGGKFFQNAVQGLCFDLLIESQVRMWKAGEIDLVLTMHDEIMDECPDEPGYTLDALIHEMTKASSWADGFPIKAAGWEGYRFKK